MAKVRYVIMVPEVVEVDMIYTEPFVTEHGRQIASEYLAAPSAHTPPDKEGKVKEYAAFVVEACVMQGEILIDQPMFTLDELVAPGAA